MLSTSRDNPVQLWDSLSGFLRCTYRAYNHVVSDYWLTHGTLLFNQHTHCYSDSTQELAEIVETKF